MVFSKGLPRYDNSDGVHGLGKVEIGKEFYKRLL